MSTTRERRWWPVSGLVFAALYLVAVELMYLPEGRYSDARVIELYRDAGTRSGIVLGGVLLVIAGLALVPFLADLRERLGPRDPLTGVAVAGGGLYVAMLFVAAGLQSGYATGVTVGELPEPVDPTLARVLSDHGFGLLLIPGLLSAGVLVLASSLAARRTAALPRALTTTGFVVAPLLLAGAAWVPSSSCPCGCSG